MGDWSTATDIRSTGVYHDGSGYDTSWPELCRCGWACVQISADYVPIRAIFGQLPGRQTVGRAERWAFLQALVHMPNTEFVVTDLASLAAEIEAWDEVDQARSRGQYADIWRRIFAVREGHDRPQGSWCTAHLSVDDYLAHDGRCVCD